MKAIGIIAEYNPFHKGHAYHIEETRKRTGADYIVVVMSGDYVQRGTPAFLNKYDRARMALLGGADLVLEMPVPFATASAEDFAACGVSLLKHTGIVDTLSFGSELGNTAPLMQIAKLLLSETPEMSAAIQSNLANGMTYPEARAAMAASVLGENVAAILASPNNILGIEYCKAILKQQASITPFTLQRQSAGYHDLTLETEYASASGIRTHLHSTNTSAILPAMNDSLPSYSEEILSARWQKECPLHENDFSALLGAALMQTKDHLTDYSDVSTELANRILKSLPGYFSFDSFADTVKSRQITRTRVNRALLHILLGITKDTVSAFKQADYCPYVRILGFKKDSASLLTELKEHCDLPIITKMAGAEKQLDTFGQELLKKEIYASDLYRMSCSVKFGIPVEKNEFTRGLQII